MRYQAIGDICLVKSKDKILARKLLKQFRTVCYQEKISGKYRLPNVRYVAGNKNLETIHLESGITYKLDVSKIMFSKGNFNERKRLITLIKPNEILLDCFAGIGYFSLGLSKFSRAKQIYAIELNPISFKYLEENIRLNRLSNIIAIKGDCKKVIPDIKADRIIMGLLPSAKKYIPTALKAVKKGGIVHYHGIAKQGREKDLLKDFGRTKVKLIKINIVKSYAPKINHIVLDVKIL